ncbi:MAG TPA: DsbA family protein [Thermomicrobiales bacterium]|nr:DsbA family protein [Thermomicrobiales bacterium]
MSQRRPNRREERSHARTKAQQQEAIKVRRRRLMMMVSAVLVIAVATVSIVIAVNNSGSDDDPTAPSPLGTAVFEGIPSSGTTLGNPDAKVTVVEYADYQCPYCANFANQNESQLITDFVKTGQIKYEFEPMPIISQLPLTNPENESVLAAQASLCAVDQGKFWSFHQLLFSKWTGENVGTFTSANLITYASQGGLDVTTFTTCLDSNKYQQTVVDSHDQGIKDGVQGTPTFIINGTVVTLTTSGYDKLKSQIQDAIDGKPIQ